MRFILIDRIISLEKNRQGTFLKNISQSEDYFADHFPGFPIMPGVLILEGFGQGSQLLIAFSHDFSVYPVMNRVYKVLFKHYVKPGDQLEISLSLLQMDQGEARVEAVARSNDIIMAQATLGFYMVNGALNTAAAEQCRRLEDMYRLLSSDPVARAWDSLRGLQERARSLLTRL